MLSSRIVLVIASIATAVTGQPLRPCITQTTALSPNQVSAMYSAIETAIADSNPRGTPRVERGDMVGGIVRLAFHDAGEFDRTTADALGPDGCVDLTKGDNAGLAPVIADLDAMWEPFCDIISKADFWVLAAKVSVEVTATAGAYEVPFRYGRATATECGYAGDRLPAAEGGVEEIQRVFVAAMGLTFRDAVALLGAHTLGRMEAANSGFEGAWTTNPDTFDNNYFVTMTQNGWDLDVVDATHTTWVRGPTIFLNADMELAYHVADEVDDLERCGPVGAGGGRNNDRCLDNNAVNSHAIEFGNDQTAWLAAFATAFQGMTEVGFAEGDLCDPSDAGTCHEPTPNPATAAPVSSAPTTTSAPVSSAPVTSAPVTQAPVTSAPVTAAPVTQAPLTSAPVSSAPTTTSAPVSSAPVTAAPVTSAPVTPAPVTSAPISSAPVSSAPVTAAPVTLAPVTPAPVTSAPISSAPVSSAPVTAAPVTSAPVTSAPTTAPTDAGSACTDTDAMCALWSTLGYCRGDHDDFMREHCQLSCHLCPGNEHATPPLNTEPNPTVTVPATTAITTAAPSAAPASCHEVQPGRADRLIGAGHCALDTVQHAVRCCSDTNRNTGVFNAWQKRGDTCPWAESNNFAEGFTACQAAMTFSEAEAMCSSAGARLCTQTEVAASCTQGTGCNFDNALVWTSTVGEISPDSLLAADAGFNRASADWSFENDDEVEAVPVTATPTTPAMVESNLGTLSSSSPGSSDGSSNAGAVAGGVLATMAIVLIAVGAVIHYRHAQRSVDGKATAMDDDVESQLEIEPLDLHASHTESGAAAEKEMSASMRLKSVRRINPAYVNSIVIDAPTAATIS